MPPDKPTHPSIECAKNGPYMVRNVELSDILLDESHRDELIAERATETPDGTSRGPRVTQV